MLVVVPPAAAAPVLNGLCRRSEPLDTFARPLFDSATTVTGSGRPDQAVNRRFDRRLLAADW